MKTLAMNYDKRSLRYSLKDGWSLKRYYALPASLSFFTAEHLSAA